MGGKASKAKHACTSRSTTVGANGGASGIGVNVTTTATVDTACVEHLMGK